LLLTLNYCSSQDIKRMALNFLNYISTPQTTFVCIKDLAVVAPTAANIHAISNEYIIPHDPEEYFQPEHLSIATPHEQKTPAVTQPDIDRKYIIPYSERYDYIGYTLFHIPPPREIYDICPAVDLISLSDYENYTSATTSRASSPSTSSCKTTPLTLHLLEKTWATILLLSAHEHNLWTRSVIELIPTIAILLLCPSEDLLSLTFAVGYTDEVVFREVMSGLLYYVQVLEWLMARLDEYLLQSSHVGDVGNDSGTSDISSGLMDIGSLFEFPSPIQMDLSTTIGSSTTLPDIPALQSTCPRWYNDHELHRYFSGCLKFARFLIY